jgi:hypothetical protein
MPSLRAEWAPRDVFAECAEALGITTTEVFSAMPTDDGAVVIYTPGVTTENVETVTTYQAVLRRDAENILRVFGEPKAIPDFFDKIMRGLEVSLKDDDDDGE